MSCIRNYKIFNTVQTVKFTELNNKNLNKIINDAKLAIDQKITKLKTLFKDLYLWCDGKYLVVYDQYMSNPNLEKLINAFGLHVQKIKCESLKGTVLVLDDSLVNLLHEFNLDYDFSKLLKLNQPKIDIRNYVKDYSTVDDQMVEILNNIRKNSIYKTKHKITFDSFMKDGKIRWKINRFIERFNNKINQSNANLIKGTTSLISYKAKRMGYTVVETKANNQVKLVLERID